MKTTILATVVSLGFMMAMAATGNADEAKKADVEKPVNLNSQVIDNSKDAGKSETQAKGTNDEATARPFHFVGHSE